MSSLESNDTSCMDVSDAMSCAAMIELSKKQAHENKVLCAYSIVNPTCEQRNSLKDPSTEYTLQANGITSKNICFNPAIMRKSGTWEYQFGLLNSDPSQNVISQYDLMTRPR
jgi:hypothetical protein